MPDGVRIGAMADQRAMVDQGVCDWVLEGGVVCQDVACEKCGYSLKTLAVEGNCPECGEAVLGSVRVTGGTTGSRIVAPGIGKLTVRTVADTRVVGDSLVSVASTTPRLRLGKTGGPLEQAVDGLVVRVL